MFCPKCGTQGIDGTKFCRSCGSDLEIVAAAMNGQIALPDKENEKQFTNCDDENSNDPDKLWKSFIQSSLIGLAFIVISIFLTITNTSNGAKWGFWMLIPGAACLGTGIASYYKAKRSEQRKRALYPGVRNTPLPPVSQHFGGALPPQQTSFYDPPLASAQKTGDLFASPSSVTEGTTRHLKHETESKSTALPHSKE
ncbi:MAG TPA: zinc ribbon domain-containing protein [Pyrinomonadaceae bacterium]|jgi:hypothetical protein|nr:zinc ribbon domain-containing protein [Pyrinomonadaceae bacterium]